MKAILILSANLVALLYFVLFFIDNQLLPNEPIHRIRNMLFVCLLFYLGYDVVSIYVLGKQKPAQGLIYQVASGAKKRIGSAQKYIQPFQKELLTWTVVAAGIIILSGVLMGPPGAVLLEIPVRLHLFHPIEGDNVWPAALFLSIIWPVGLPVGVLVKHYLLRAGYATYAPYGCPGTIAFGLCFFLGLTFFLFGRPK